jgi:hypothetical protein
MGAGLLMAGFPPIPGTSGAVLPASPTNVPRIGDFGHAPGGTSIQDVNGRFIRGGFGFTWEGLDAVLGLPLRFQEYITKAVAATAADIAEEMQAYAQENAPWEDRTGDARSGLKAVKVEDRATDSFSIFLGHSVSYGIYLETYNGGQLAIVKPTVEHFAPLVMGRVRERIPRG